MNISCVSGDFTRICVTETKNNHTQNDNLCIHKVLSRIVIESTTLSAVEIWRRKSVLVEGFFNWIRYLLILFITLSSDKNGIHYFYQYIMKCRYRYFYHNFKVFSVNLRHLLFLFNLIYLIGAICLKRRDTKMSYIINIRWL